MNYQYLKILTIGIGKYFLRIVFLFCIFLSPLASLWAQGIVERVDESKTYEIDQEHSYIHVYTGTAGLLKAFSHKHLVSIRGIEGTVHYNESNSWASFSVYPDQFTVDDDIERSQAIDEDYQKEVAEWIKDGTKKNMNGEKLLDAELYPVIQVAVTPENLASETNFFGEISLKGQQYQKVVPGTLSISEAHISAQGDFYLSHDDLGLQQFSVPGGAAKVAAELRFVFDIRSSRSPSVR